MAAGRPPKPRALKKLQGTFRAQRDNKAAPAPPDKRIVKPRWLSPLGTAAWRRWAPMLEEMGILTAADLDALAITCEAYAEFVELTQFLRENQRTFAVVSAKATRSRQSSQRMYPRPEVAMAQNAWRRAYLGLSDFGLNPSTRSRLVVEPAKDDVDPFSIFDGRPRGA